MGGRGQGSNRVLPREHSTWPSSVPKERSCLRGWRKSRPSRRAFWLRAAKKKSFSGIEGDGGRIVRNRAGPGQASARLTETEMLKFSIARSLSLVRPPPRMGMAYYPGNYHRNGFEHIGDYYSQGLFGATAQQPHDFDHYSDSNNEHEYESSRPSRRPPRTALPSSSPPRPSQRRSASPPSRSYHQSEHPPPRPPRPRSRSPPQNRPSSPRPAAPSASYLDFASEPSQTLSEPTRKLLVLDLNGSLLLRSARIPKSYRGLHHHNQYPAPRRVMPRPYLTAFRAYLFASQTRAWLDVMVWSSAQPHSVEDMVLHAFGDDRDKLFAVWARDTLGLAEDHYCQSIHPSPFSL